MTAGYQLVVLGSVVPDPLQTLEPVPGPALRNEAMLVSGNQNRIPNTMIRPLVGSAAFIVFNAPDHPGRVAGDDRVRHTLHPSSRTALVL